MKDNQDYKQDSFKPKKRKVKLALTIVTLILLIVIGGGVGGALYVANALQPVAASDQEVRLSIPAGSGSAQISKLLEKQGLIKDSFIFVYYLKKNKQGSRFQAGEYAMKPGLSLDQIISQLNNGETIKEEVMRITIPEGFTVSQIADKLSEQPTWKATAFMEKVNSGSGLKSSLLTEIPADPEIKHRLEGYLFPETYEFKKGTTEEQFIERTLQELERKLSSLPADWKRKLTERGLTFHQMLTVASLIEREVVVEDERSVVAGVIYNRLNKKMPLQIDATVQYLMKSQKERLFEKDLLIESPYNTYKNTGLPPGPIASPSLASIKAALYPADTKYFYYVTKKDGTQGHLFGVTYDDHLKNIADSKKGTN
ncbi:putative aminodeoxychorismate lyase [compost metagenome]